MMHAVFRRAKLEDVSRIQEILSNAWRITYKDLYPQEKIEEVIQEFYNTERITREISENSSVWMGYYVVEHEGVIYGTIGGGVDERGIGHIYVLYLDPEHKGKGYGRILVDNFTRIQIEEYHVSIQRVSVSVGNDMGLPFYRKLGFKMLSQQDTFSMDGDYKAWLMERRVS